MQEERVSTELVGNPTDSAWLSGLAKAMSENLEFGDAYDALIGAIRLACPHASGNSILVTSAEPGEGKTTISSGLAVAASLAGQKALLIDGDLRRLSLSEAVGCAGSRGLIEILLGQAEVAEVIRPVTLMASRPANVVSFIAGGRRSSISLTAVDWAKARSAFKSLSQQFGIVVVDSPPVLAANDALLFAGIVDAVLLVVGAGKANIGEVRRAKEQLESIGAPSVGAILNRFEPRRHGRSNQPYRGYYRRART
jgi:capsular exopolysaccharide synthesis family protein